MDHELTRITCDEDWLDLRDGETAILAGKVNGDIMPGRKIISVSMPDWSVIVARVVDPEALPVIPDRQHVTIIVERDEDGLTATARHISKEGE